MHVLMPQRERAGSLLTMALLFFQ